MVANKIQRPTGVTTRSFAKGARTLAARAGRYVRQTKIKGCPLVAPVATRYPPQNRDPRAHLAGRSPVPLRARLPTPTCARSPPRSAPAINDLGIPAPAHADAHHQLHQRLRRLCAITAPSIASRAGWQVRPLARSGLRQTGRTARPRRRPSLARERRIRSPPPALDHYCDPSAQFAPATANASSSTPSTDRGIHVLADHAEARRTQPRPSASVLLASAGLTGGGFRDSDGGLPPPPQQVQATSSPTTDAAQRVPRRVRPAHLSNHGHRLRRNHRGAHRRTSNVPASFRLSAGGLRQLPLLTYKPRFTQLGAASRSPSSENFRHLALQPNLTSMKNFRASRTSVLTPEQERALEGLLYGADDF